MERAAKRFAAAVGIALVLFAVAVRVARPTRTIPGPVASAGATASPTPALPGKGRPVLVFFAEPEGQGLVARRTEVAPVSDGSLLARAILDAALAGPAALPAPAPGEEMGGALPALPPGVSVRAVFFDGKGTAIVDLAGLAGRLTGGTEAEVLALWSVVNALAFNFPVEARRVRVLLEGREGQELGHVSLAAPLAPRRDLVAGEIPSLAVPLAAGQRSAPEDDDDEDEDTPSPFDDLVPVRP